MAQETAVLEALAGVTGWEIDDGRLHLTGRDRARLSNRPPREARPRPRAPCPNRRSVAACRRARRGDAVPKRWVDLEVGPTSAVAPTPSSPITSRCSGGPSRRSTTTSPPACGSTRCGRSWSSSKRDASRTRTTPSMPRSRLRPARPPPPSLRDFYAFERHVGTMWSRRAARSRRPGTGCRSSTSATCRRSADPATRSGRRAARRSSTTSSRWRRSSTHRHGPRRGARRGGHRRLLDPQRLVGTDLQREETTVRLGPGQGQGLRDVDRTVAGDAR